MTSVKWILRCLNDYPIQLASYNTDTLIFDFLRSFLTIFIKLSLILGERDD